MVIAIKIFTLMAGTMAAIAITPITINWTLVITVITICLAAMGTIIKIFGTKTKINDESLRNSSYLQSIESAGNKRSEKLDQLKELINIQYTEVEKLKILSQNSTKGLEELKKDNRDLVQRLDDLLRQLMEYMEG